MTDDTNSLPNSASNSASDSGHLPSQPYRSAQVSGKKPLHFTFAPDAAARAQIAAEVSLLDLPEFSFAGVLSPKGRADVTLTAHLTALVIQPCGITLAPVRSRLTEEVQRSYLHDFAQPDADESEIGPEDLDPLPEIIDVAAIAIEALALLLPLYPRARGAELAESIFAPPGVTPLKDADLRPFAGLAGLAAALKSTNSDKN